MPITIAQLLLTDAHVDRLAALDVKPLRPGDTIDALGVVINGAEPFEPFARDGAGGLYVQGGATSHIAYVSSEGSAGIVAASLDEFVGLLVTIPVWREVLYHSANGMLNEMLVAARVQQVHEDPDASRQARDAFGSIVEIPSIEKAVTNLHRALLELGKSVEFTYQNDGYPLDGLMGPHTGASLKARYERWHSTLSGHELHCRD